MTLFRYLFGQLLVPYVMSVIILTFVVSMNTVYSLINLIVSNGVPPSDVFLLLLFRMPQFLSVTMPLAVVIAVLVVMVRISLDLEFIAMRAAGISFRLILLPFFVFGLMLTSITWMVTLWAQPAGYAAFEKEQLRIVKSQTSKQIQPKVLNYNFSGKVLYVQEKHEDETLSGVFIADQKLRENSLVVMADQGRVFVNESKQEMVLKLKKGTIHLTTENPEQYRTIAFDDFDYIFKLPSMVPSDKGSIWGVPTSELLEKNDHKARVELLLRLTTPMACLGFALASIPLGISNPRSGRTGSYLRALMLVVVYYILWMGAKNLTFHEGYTPHTLWGPPIIILSYGLYTLFKFNYNLVNIIEVGHRLFRKSDFKIS